MNDNNRPEIARRLQLARKQAGLTQGQIASIIGLPRPAISEIEAGRRKVSAEELIALSEAYGISISWLTSLSSRATPPAVELAARELAKLKQEDLDAVLNLLKTLRSTDTE
ncbi:helix-turn-helix transcriptional regulator [Desulfovibrio sp.]|uniref:helix-turn-helix domain-containing protein n=1 Tax=Desulfovibrio sp. TaxID=885 RepID=UPI0025BE7FB5|nr:helix-turn-helix transcriptional regulator [Desulfovibrio sp.]